MTTHVGKIGRLPKGCREELGRRIEDGHSGRELVDWLNGLPDVQVVLREKFGGREINETNLSSWRQSGHLNWLRRQEARERLRELIEDSNRLDDAAGDWPVGERLGAVVAAEMNGLAMALLSQEPDLTKRWKYFCEIHREVSRMRQDDDRAQRMILQQERWDQELAKRGIELERVKRCVAPPRPGFGATSPTAPDLGVSTEGKGDENENEDEGETAEMAANLENSRQIKEDQGEGENRNPNPEIREKSEGPNLNQGAALDSGNGAKVQFLHEERLWCEEPGYEILHTRDKEHGTRYRKVPIGWQDPEKNEVQGSKSKAQSLGTGSGEGRGMKNEAEARAAVPGNTGLESPVNSQAGKPALHKESPPELTGGDACGTISLPCAPAYVPDPDPEVEAYNRWWRMNRNFERFDAKELDRIYAELPQKIAEYKAKMQRGERAGELMAECMEGAGI